MTKNLLCLTILVLIGSITWTFFDFYLDDYLRQEGKYQTNDYEVVNVSNDGAAFIFEATLKSKIPFYSSIINFKAANIIARIEPLCEEVINVKIYDKSKAIPQTHSNLNIQECSRMYKSRMEKSLEDYEKEEKEHHHEDGHVHNHSTIADIYNSSHKFSIQYKSSPFSIEIRDSKSKVLLLDTALFDFVIGSDLSTFTSPLLNNSVHIPGDFNIKYNKVYSSKEFGSFPLFFSKSLLKYVHGYFFNTDKPLSLEFNHHKKLNEDQFIVKSYSDFIDFSIVTESEFKRLVSKLQKSKTTFNQRLETAESFLDKVDKNIDSEFIRFECLKEQYEDIITKSKKQFAQSKGHEIKTAKEVKDQFAEQKKCEDDFSKISNSSKKTVLSSNGLFINAFRIVLEQKNIKEMQDLIFGSSMVNKPIVAINTTKSTEILLSDVSLTTGSNTNAKDHFFVYKKLLKSHINMLKLKKNNILLPLFFHGDYKDKHKNWITQYILGDNIMIVNGPNIKDPILTYFPENQWFDLHTEKISPKDGAKKEVPSIYLKHATIVQINSNDKKECSFDIYGVFHGMNIMNMKTFIADGYISCKNTLYHMSFIGTNFQETPNINLRVSKEYGDDPFEIVFIRFFNYDIDGKINKVAEGGKVFQHSKEEFSLLFENGLKVPAKEEWNIELINDKEDKKKVEEEEEEEEEYEDEGEEVEEIAEIEGDKIEEVKM